MPDFFSVVPVGEHFVLNGVFQGEDTTLGLGFISDIGISLFHSHLLETCEKRGMWCEQKILGQIGKGSVITEQARPSQSHAP